MEAGSAIVMVHLDIADLQSVKIGALHFIHKNKRPEKRSFLTSCCTGHLTSIKCQNTVPMIYIMIIKL
jgi:hypothetical protein